VSTVDESHAQDSITRWITEAREAGIPVCVTGLVLFWGVLGIPAWLVATLLGLAMALGLMVAARTLFGPEGSESSDW
jgi:hypothetical protein